jgi:hypothetical protein
MSNIMTTPLQIIGPSNNPYPGTICLPQVPLPANATVNVGDKATIQVVEQAQHGAALYSVRHLLDLFLDPVNHLLSVIMPANISIQCVDIIFAAPGDPKIGLVNETNCFNSTDLGFADMYTITIKDSGSNVYTTSGAISMLHQYNVAGWLPLLICGAIWLL